MHQILSELQNCRRIAVMGGTFDPIHLGHLVVAEAVLHEYKPDRILFIPAGCPAHKDNAFVTPGEHRYLMTVLATADHPRFDVLRMEIDRQGPSYTIDTIRELRQRCRKDTELLFITGADAVEQILTWKDAETLLGLCRFIAVTRPGFSRDALLRQMEILRADYAGRLHFLEAPALAISSSDIRERISRNGSVRYLLPTAVEAYIRKYALYGTPSETLKKQSLTTDEMKAMLSTRLSERRFSHTMGVIESAEQLADCYGADRYKASIAGLLHDCAKEYSAEQKRALCQQFNIPLDEILNQQIDLAHSLLSAEIAKRDFGIDDPEILQAIRYHTTGHGDMTLLDKIVMLADFIEPTREDYPGLQEVREWAFLDIDKALLVGIREVIRANKQRGRPIHSWSQEALKCLKAHRNANRGK